jgi:hypothetical protein
MGSNAGDRSRERLAGGGVPPNLLAALLQLGHAAAYAREAGRPDWDFAVEVECLRALGLTNSELRWLVCKGYAEHAAETTPAGSEGRCFAGEARLLFGACSCFVITARGEEWVQGLAPPGKADRGRNGDFPNGKGTCPHWNAALRVLSVGGRVVKQYRVPAENQELILAAFEELSWPPHLDDPLPPAPGLDSQQRLRDTTGRLNHNQKHRLIRFHGDGHGRGLWWELLA